MENVKRFALMVFVAILGGIISIFGYRQMEGRQTLSGDNFSFARKANYEFKNVTVPSFDFAAVSEVAMPTVVHIKTVSNVAEDRSNRPASPFDIFGDQFGGPQGPQMGSGSGVIISTDGYIVTNNHVVSGADEIEVILYDKRSYKGDVIGRDPNTDMALVKIEAEDLQAIKIGNSDNVKVGEWVLAVGNPFNLTSTVTAGIVSAKGRNIQILGGGTAIESFIQTDAAVNPGNSGGALVNTKGELVGINTAIATHTGQYEGYSFAVPVNIMKKVIDDIMEYGEVQRGFIGVQIQDVTAKIAEEKGLKRPMGVLVEDITDGGAAEAAGLKKGDVIMKVDDRAIHSVSELQETIGRHRPGDAVMVSVMRSGAEKQYKLVLRNKDNKIGTVTSSSRELKKELGASFENISADQKSRLKLGNGVRISEVEKGVFKEAGIPAGFIITSIDKIKVFSSNDVYKAVEGKKGGLLVEGIKPSGEKGYYVLEMK